MNRKDSDVHADEFIRDIPGKKSYRWHKSTTNITSLEGSEKGRGEELRVRDGNREVG